CYIGLRGAQNATEMADVPAEKMRLYQGLWWKPVHAEQRCSHTRWVVLRWPTPSMAQQAGMSTEAFEDFYFEVCNLDYARVDTAVQPLKRRMEAARAGRLVAPGTDILFDEKIAGSIHFTPGSAYEICDNGNRSQVHWDMVLIQRPEYGGGEIWLDDELIRRDGRFVVPDLEPLNPEHLGAGTE